MMPLIIVVVTNYQQKLSLSEKFFVFCPLAQICQPALVNLRNGITNIPTFNLIIVTAKG